jgi:hypothetical protein
VSDDAKNLRDQVYTFHEAGHCCTSGHCWHAKNGAIWMVIKDGYVVQECCDCTAIRSVHRDHLMGSGRDDFKRDEYVSESIILSDHGWKSPEGWEFSSRIRC